MIKSVKNSTNDQNNQNCLGDVRAETQLSFLKWRWCDQLWRCGMGSRWNSRCSFLLLATEPNRAGGCRNSNPKWNNQTKNGRNHVRLPDAQAHFKRLNNGIPRKVIKCPFGDAKPKESENPLEGLLDKERHGRYPTAKSSHTSSGQLPKSYLFRGCAEPVFCGTIRLNLT